MNWAVELDAAAAAACGALRHVEGVEACMAAGRLWLRGAAINEPLAALLRRLPALERYAVTADGRLVPDGRIVPRRRLPAGPWLPLHSGLPLEPPAARDVTSANTPAMPRLPLEIVRGGPERPAKLLVTRFEAWAAHALEAPAIRLARWSFAASDTGAVLVRGLPLPSLPGRWLVEEGGVAVEAGWAWSPAVAAAAIRGLLGTADDDLVILARRGDAAAQCMIVPGDAFVKATRSAVRLTAEATRGGAR